MRKKNSLNLMVEESEDLVVEERMVDKTNKRRKQCILDTIMSNDRQILQSKCLKEHEVEIIAVIQAFNKNLQPLTTQLQPYKVSIFFNHLQSCTLVTLSPFFYLFIYIFFLRINVVPFIKT